MSDSRSVASTPRFETLLRSAKRLAADSLIRWETLQRATSGLISTRFEESRWTRPTDFCPHPERWHSLDGPDTELEVTALVAAMVTALQPSYVVETGTASAQTAVAIGKSLRRNGHGRLLTLEIDRQLVQHARRLCKGLPVDVRHQRSLEFEPQQPIDFLWLDSEVHLRAEEFRRFYPFMHHRTVVGFHDTAPHLPGLQQRIEQLQSDCC